MLFNSDTFLLFFAGFHLLYFLCRRSLRTRNLLILAASYLFYGWWDRRFLLLLVLTSVVDFYVGVGLQAEALRPYRRRLLWLSLTINLAVLGFFKYCDFFLQSMAALLRTLHIPFETGTLGIILPVGISFYTFQSMSYTIDVYRGTLKPTTNLVDFLAYVAFFPQLVAGPIERAAHLLPQFERTLSITTAMLAEGLWLILWGLFKKVVLADNFAPLIEMVYGNNLQSGLAISLATVAFGLQIYCDFSGYSDIARGTARTLGFDILFNFNLPYCATHLREFWRRWHISLSTWLRDYLYISLGGNRLGLGRTYVNLMLTMLLGGLWHGAAWNFVLWGLWHGLGLCAVRFWEQIRPEGRPMPGPVAWLGTMLFIFYGWLLFRAGSWSAVRSLTLSLAHLDAPVWLGSYVINLVVFALPLVAFETWCSRRGDVLAVLSMARWKQGLLQGLLLGAIVFFWEKKSSPFIYFQF